MPEKPVVARPRTRVVLHRHVPDASTWTGRNRKFPGIPSEERNLVEEAEVTGELFEDNRRTEEVAVNVTASGGHDSPLHPPDCPT